MRNTKPWLWIALAIACCAGIASAGEMADSTGKVRAKKALQVPAGLSLDDVLSAVRPMIKDPADVPVIPVGYKEVTFSAGPHIGVYQTYEDVTYGYSKMENSLLCDDNGTCWGQNYSLDPSICEGNYTHRIVDLKNASSVHGVTGLYTCEPYGSVTKLVKTGMPAEVATITQAQIDSYKIGGTIGVSTSGTSAICKVYGYTDFLPGTISSWYKGGGCPGGYITQYNGSAWISNTACYNNVLTGLQCYK